MSRILDLSGLGLSGMSEAFEVHVHLQAGWHLHSRVIILLGLTKLVQRKYTTHVPGCACDVTMVSAAM